MFEIAARPIAQGKYINEISEIDKCGNDTFRPNEWGEKTIEDLTLSINTNLNNDIWRNSGLMSCISIRKNIILPHLEILSKLTTNQDLFMFLIALHSNTKVVLAKNQLTYYRISDSVTRIQGTFNKYLSILRRTHKNDYIVNNYFEEIFKNSANCQYIKKRIFELNLVYFFVSKKRETFNYISTALNENQFLTIKNKIFFLVLSLLHDISPNLFLRINFITNKRRIAKYQ